MAATDGIAEVAGTATRAEAAARAVNWVDADAVDRAVRRIGRTLNQDRAALASPPVSAVVPTSPWAERLAAMTGQDRDADDVLPGDPLQAVARAEANADAAVAIARLGVLEAERALLAAKAAHLRAGDTPESAVAARGYRTLAARHVAVRYGGAVGSAATGELSEVVTGRSKAILVKLGVGLGIGVAYLVFLRVFQWENKAETLPYLAPYALSGVIGGVVCTNALSWDARRVKAALSSGQRLWLVLVSKNVSMFLLVGAVGLVLCLFLAWRAGDARAFVTAFAELVTMMLIWLGIGNVLSVTQPLRVEPLAERRKDGTLWPFLLSFAISYVVGLGVNLILTWKFWAKQSMADELGGLWVPVLMLTLTALVAWALLTVLAVSLADLPQFRRKMMREVVEYAKPPKGADAPRP